MLIKILDFKIFADLLKARLNGHERNSSKLTPSHPTFGSKHIGNCSGLGNRPLQTCLDEDQVAPLSTWLYSEMKRSTGFRINVVK